MFQPGPRRPDTNHKNRRYKTKYKNHAPISNLSLTVSRIFQHNTSCLCDLDIIILHDNGQKAGKGPRTYPLTQKDRKACGTSAWCRPSTLSPVSKPSGPRGALPGPPDFWCNRHCNTSPVVLSRQGNVLGPQRPHPKHMFHQNKHDLRRGVWPCAKTKPQQTISKQPPKTQTVRVSSQYPPPETVENLNASFLKVCVNDGTWTLY